MMFHKNNFDFSKFYFINRNLSLSQKFGRRETPCFLKTLCFAETHTFFCRREITNKFHTKKEHMFGIQSVAEKAEKDAPRIETRQRQNKKREKRRSSLILPKHIGRVFFVHNGKTFSSIEIYKKMLGHKFGEFASTRKKPVHKKKR